MTYSSSTVSKALATLAGRKEKAEEEAKSRKEEFIKAHPEYGEIEAKLSQTGVDAIKAVMGCKDPKEYIESLKKDNLKFQEAKKAFLTANGFDEDYLEPAYHCKKCKDTGYVEGVICECFEELLNKLSADELSVKTPLQLSRFEDFDLSLYRDSAKQKMSDIYNFCVEYAKTFDRNTYSLYMFGNTGLGKTHLSLAIAAEVIKKGYSVVYGSAHDFFGMIERERFGRSENPDGTTGETRINRDVLVIDDLGAEFVTQFTVSELYYIVDTRLAKGYPTIISTNLKADELEKTYNERIASRILYNYYRLDFIGNDIRQALDVNLD